MRTFDGSHDYPLLAVQALFAGAHIPGIVFKPGLKPSRRSPEDRAARGDRPRASSARSSGGRIRRGSGRRWACG